MEFRKAKDSWKHRATIESPRADTEASERLGSLSSFRSLVVRLSRRHESFQAHQVFLARGNNMFVIVSADGTIRRTFKGTDPATVVELACELQCEGDENYSLRLAEARRLLDEEDAMWVS